MAPSGRHAYANGHGTELFFGEHGSLNAQQNGGSWAKIEQDTRRYVLRAKGMCM